MSSEPHTGQSTNTTAAITLRYFAWVREKAGIGEERVSLPAHIDTIADLIAWQQARGEGFANAFARPETIRCARDQVHVKPDAKIAGAREIGFFPPVTGG